MIPNRIFTWLAVILIIYVLIANRGSINSPEPIATPASEIAAPTTQPPSPQPTIIEEKEKNVLEIPAPTQGEQKNIDALAPSTEELSPSEQQKLMEQLATIKALAEKAKNELEPANQKPEKRRTSSMFSRENISIADFSINAKKRSGMLVEDKLRGQGPAVYCGSTIKLHYKLTDPDAKDIFTTRTKEEPETIKIGAGTVIKGLENGIIGMRKGGIRKITIPANYAFDDPKFAGQGPKDLKVIAEVELQDIINPFENSSKMPLRIYDDNIPSYGDVLEVVCGQEVSVNYALWNMEGELVATSIADEKTEKSPGKSKMKSDVALPLTFKLGEGKVPLALEAAVSGNEDVGTLRITGKRTLIVPPDFLKTLAGKQVATKVFDGVKIPEKKAMILEVELLKVEGAELPKINF